MNWKRGQKIKYVDDNPDAVRWGGNDNPAGILKIGETYTVFGVVVHAWHTKVYLEEKPGFRFNSAHFEEV